MQCAGIHHDLDQSLVVAGMSRVIRIGLTLVGDPGDNELNETYCWLKAKALWKVIV
ncbi:hypothetical protein KSX_41560 [Ktedonospora formicarum]|uniref:Uncharacterized protein n=1 Tax=Ktedonospora formicarum TaxID=2778364 RepID=A0A8J3I4W4_9CHLR|nr:hypothetical protein KSX_41560 [Ktedonospora formicarum]